MFSMGRLHNYIVGRDAAGVTVPAGNSRNVTFGSGNGVDDNSILGDPQQIRSLKSGNTFMGIKIPAEYDKCVLTAKSTLNGLFAAAASGNFVTVKLYQYRGAQPSPFVFPGTPLRVILMATYSPDSTEKVVETTERVVYGYMAVGEDIAADDYFLIGISVDDGQPDPAGLWPAPVGSANDFQVILHQVSMTIQKST